MIKFTTTILKQEEKLGWTYILIPEDLAQELKPVNRQSFRVKGKLDQYAIKAIALMPVRGGGFIMPLNAALRKAIGKRHGAKLQVQLAIDDNPEPVACPELMECLADDPDALAHFNNLTKGHRNYFMQWINSAKTAPTKEKRIAMTVIALSKKQGFPEMMRAQKDNKLF